MHIWINSAEELSTVGITSRFSYGVLAVNVSHNINLDGSRMMNVTMLNPFSPPASKRYVLRLFISLRFVTANVVDRRSGRVVISASTVEKSLQSGLDCGRTCNTKAAAAVGEVLAMRLKVDGLSTEPIHAHAAKEIEKKGFKNRTKIWAVLNALRSGGVNLLLEDGVDQDFPARS